jgi:polyhydroxybutyrate depolymerase
VNGRPTFSESHQSVFADTTGVGRPSATLQWPSTFNANPTATRPLVVLASSRNVAVGTLQHNWGLDTLASDMNAFVLPVNGKTGTFGVNSWNGNNCCCWSVSSDGAAPDDSGYLAGQVANVIAAGWPVDPKRVYGLGESAGEGVLWRSACDYAATWTAIFGFSGAPSVTSGDAACSPSQPFAIAHAHGTSDASAEPWTGVQAPNAGMPNACESTIDSGGVMDDFRTLNSCGSLNVTTTGWADLDSGIGGAETDLLDAASCTANGAVELWRMNSTTHSLTPTATWETKIIGWFNSQVRP